jgi:hypothetical protein
MKQAIAAALVVLSLATVAQGAKRVVRTRTTARGTHVRTVTTVHHGFPIHRTLPSVVVRGPVVRVAPAVYLAPLTFTAVAVATPPPPAARVWSESESLDPSDYWVDFSLDVDRKGKNLLLEVDHGTAQISFAEVVFENGETQVIDFNDRVHARGTYELLDIRNGRKIDHVRIVARADQRETAVTVHLIA